MPADAPLTLSLRRFSALLAALRDGPLNRHALLDRLGDAYPRTASARPMVDRDVKRLRARCALRMVMRSTEVIHCKWCGATHLQAIALGIQTTKRVTHDTM